MSQSDNPKDTQALLQSMLQRLKLQPGKEGQAYLHTPVPITAASSWGQDGERGASSPQKVNNSPVNGFEFGTNGIPSKEFGISAADSDFGLKGGEVQQPDDGHEVDKSLISFPSQKDSVDGDMGEDRVLAQGIQPGITPTGAGQLFPATSLKDADITSFERTDGAMVNFGSSEKTGNISSDKDADASMGQNGTDQEQVPGFTPKVYSWSLKPIDASLSSQENDLFHMGNGGPVAQSKDIVPSNSSSRRQQRTSENKTRRWTQKIKDRWRDRPGSFGKKGKVGGGSGDQRSEQKTEISPQNQPLTTETVINASDKEEERTLPSLDSSDLSNTPPANTEDSTNEAYMRWTSDFGFGLGSFSLLEEIVTGQEWAKFLNPNQSAASTNQRPTELKIPPNPYDSSQAPLIVNQHEDASSLWGFRGTEEASPDSDFSMAQIPPDAFQPVSMDVTEGKQAAAQDVHGEADQPEPMEHGNTRRPPSSPADILNSSVMKKRVPLNRKRQHQSAERRDERLQAEKISDGKEADGDDSISSLSQTSNHVMEETGEQQHDDATPLYNRSSPPPPLSPSTSLATAPRSCLKHSISQDSQCSMETETKRRRVEENRRVRFSEEVVTIAPPELDPDATDSEEDSGEEDDSLTEQVLEEEEQAMIEEVAAPARRAALPAWILALKRKNPVTKYRKGL